MVAAGLGFVADLDTQCAFCGRDSIMAICESCEDERWSVPCRTCGEAIEPRRLALGATTCHDCPSDYSAAEHKLAA